MFKGTATFVLAIWIPVLAFGNVYWPKARLAGEVVDAHLMKDFAVVKATFEFDDLDGVRSDKDAIYIPIFVDQKQDPVGVLLESELELKVEGQSGFVAEPCQAPTKYASLNLRPPAAQWYEGNIGVLLAETKVQPTGRVVITMQYQQKLIGGFFYYLPAISMSSGELSTRSWRYQIHVHSDSRVPALMNREVASTVDERGRIVYLKDGEILKFR